MAPFAIHVTPPAQRHLRDAQRWWLENRLAAPLALHDELQRALDLITHQPRAGVPHRGPSVRRILLVQTGYVLFYRIRPRAMRIDVLALWHGRRGAAPPLPHR
ncbi:MAG: type II toxin-antitoxin system RelE/ParE family toxin [Candidatus Eisenbacteria bacterium]